MSKKLSIILVLVVIIAIGAWFKVYKPLKSSSSITEVPQSANLVQETKIINDLNTSGLTIGANQKVLSVKSYVLSGNKDFTSLTDVVYVTSTSFTTLLKAYREYFAKNGYKILSDALEENKQVFRVEKDQVSISVYLQTIDTANTRVMITEAK